MSKRRNSEKTLYVRIKIRRESKACVEGGKDLRRKSMQRLTYKVLANISTFFPQTIKELNARD
jgi:hypothetical protein